MEAETIIAVATLSGACLLLLVLVAVLFSQVSSLRRQLDDVLNGGRLRVQKLTLDNNDKNHAFHNPTISPDEELARRGFSMYAGEDLESGRPAPNERQTGGQLVDELARELDYRHQRQELQQQQQVQQQQLQHQHLQQQQLHHQQQHQRPPSPPYQPQQLQQQQQQAPPFLLQSIEEKKRKNRQQLANPVANGGSRQLSDTNPNFIY